MSSHRRGPRAAVIVPILLVGGVVVWTNRARLPLIGHCPAPAEAEAPSEAAPSGPPAPTTTRVPHGPPVNVTGTIVDGACDRPLEGAVVWAVQADDAHDLVGIARTDGDGRYSMTVPADRYRFTMQDGGRRGYVSRWYPTAGDDAAAEVVDVQSDAALQPVALYRVPDLPPDPYTGPVPGRRAAVIGDSLVQQSTTPIHHALEAAGPVSVVGAAGQRTDQMEPVADRYDDTHPDVVVVALGNNDLLQGHPAGDALDDLRRMVDGFERPACVVLLNLTTHSANADFNRAATELDAAIPQLAAERPWLRVGDWNAEVERMLGENPDGLAWFTDGLHLRPAAMARYGKVMADTAATC
jgi:hypothetical protein